MASALSLIRHYRQKRASWRHIANDLNVAYGVKLSPSAYEQWATKGREPANPNVRRALGLGPRVCPHCKRKMPTTPRHTYKPQDPALEWWRNSLSSAQRQQYIKSLYEQHI